MKLGFKIAIFTLMLNLAAGIIIFSIPSLGAENLSVIQPVADQTAGNDAFNEGLEGNVSLPSTSQDTMNIKDILFDAFALGKIIKLVKGVGTLLFGFSQMLYNLFLTFTPKTDASTYLTWLNYIKGILMTLTSTAYGLGVFWLFTGKAIDRE